MTLNRDKPINELAQIPKSSSRHNPGSDRNTVGFRWHLLTDNTPGRVSIDPYVRLVHTDASIATDLRRFRLWYLPVHECISGRWRCSRRNNSTRARDKETTASPTPAGTRGQTALGHQLHELSKSFPIHHWQHTRDGRPSMSARTTSVSKAIVRQNPTLKTIATAAMIPSKHG